MDLLYTVDRREGTWIVLEDDSGRTFQVPQTWLPSGTREGDIVRLAAQPGATQSATNLLFALAPELREQRRNDAARQRETLPRGPKGDVSL